MVLGRADKFRAYKEAIEIVKAAYGSETSYRLDFLPGTLQATYDKLKELLEDVYDSKEH